MLLVWLGKDWKSSYMLAAVPLCTQALCKESCKCMYVVLTVATDISAGRFNLCIVTLPFRAVGEVLDHFYDRFCEEMDASSIVWQLVQKGIIHTVCHTMHIQSMP